MSFKFESVIIDLLLSPLVQDDFKATRLEELLLFHYAAFDLDQIEDVVQILFKCITALQNIGNKKCNYICMHSINMYI